MSLHQDCNRRRRRFARHADRRRRTESPSRGTLAERNAYILMMDGKTKTVRLNERAVGMLMKNAKRVPRGTVLMMSNGQLYQVNASKMMFDRAGNWMAIGGGG